VTARDGWGCICDGGWAGFAARGGGGRDGYISSSLGALKRCLMLATSGSFGSLTSSSVEDMTRRRGPPGRPCEVALLFRPPGEADALDMFDADADPVADADRDGENRPGRRRVSAEPESWWAPGACRNREPEPGVDPGVVTRCPVRQPLLV
jgi:hypothetical protein